MKVDIDLALPTLRQRSRSSSGEIAPTNLRVCFQRTKTYIRQTQNLRSKLEAIPPVPLIPLHITGGSRNKDLNVCSKKGKVRTCVRWEPPSIGRGIGGNGGIACCVDRTSVLGSGCVICSFGSRIASSQDAKAPAPCGAGAWFGGWRDRRRRGASGGRRLRLRYTRIVARLPEFDNGRGRVLTSPLATRPLATGTPKQGAEGSSARKKTQ